MVVSVLFRLVSNSLYYMSGLINTSGIISMETTRCLQFVFGHQIPKM